MLNFFSPSLRLGVAADRLTLVRTRGWRGAPELVADHPLAAHDFAVPERFAAALRLVLADAPRATLTVVLADELVRLWQVTPPQGASRIADVEAAAGLRFQTLYGEAPAAWKLTADWSAGAPFLAAAMPRATLAALEQVARELRLTIIAAAPQFVMAWNRWHGALRADAWYALVHENLLTLGVIKGARLHAVRAAPVPRDAGPDWLRAHVAREALLLGLDAPDQLQASGQVPPSWLAASSSGLRCSRLDPERRALAPLAAGALLAQTGAAR